MKRKGLWGSFLGRENLSGEESFRQRDYHKCQWRRGERERVVGFSVGAVCLLAYFFYRSVVAVPFLCFVGVIVYRYLAEGKQIKQREELGQQFRECILSVSVALQSGYAIENAFVESEQDMRLLFGEDSFICEELRVIRRGLGINIPLEELLGEFGRRSDCEEIRWFVEVFGIAKRSGGNLVDVIRETATLIGKKVDSKKEIAVILSGKRMELGVMEAMPFVFFLYIEMTNPGYFDKLYHNFTGIAIMSGCLAVYVIAFVLGEKMIRSIGLR